MDIFYFWKSFGLGKDDHCCLASFIFRVLACWNYREIVQFCIMSIVTCETWSIWLTLTMVCLLLKHLEHNLISETKDLRSSREMSANCLQWDIKCCGDLQREQWFESWLSAEALEWVIRQVEPEEEEPIDRREVWWNEWL